MNKLSYLIDWSLTFVVLIVLTISYFNCFCIDSGTVILFVYLAMRAGLECLKLWYKVHRRQWVAFLTLSLLIVMYIVLVVGLAKI